MNEYEWHQESPKTKSQKELRLEELKKTKDVQEWIRLKGVFIYSTTSLLEKHISKKRFGLL